MLAGYFWAKYFLVRYFFSSNFFASFVPFILAHATAMPASNLMQILSRPHHKELALRTNGLVKIFRPFAGFLEFCVGKLLITVCFIYGLDITMPGFLAKPFSMYAAIGVFMLSPLGLHFFLAYQEFVFYSLCSYYRAFVKHVSVTSEEESKVARRSPIQPNSIHLKCRKVGYQILPIILCFGRKC